ncbi:MAG TPA: Tex-like N-terminal domain-containing protein, partial [Ktedonobacteraceae bacterium]|nr:Tex-like N-terminal domain-containing protein [Ktedonobacteraceae bacterium]
MTYEESINQKTQLIPPSNDGGLAAGTALADAQPLQVAELAQRLSKELAIGSGQIARTIALLDEGNTIPFIARYRKEVTGSLDEVQIQAIADRALALRTLHDRKGDVTRLIDGQGKLTPELASAIAAAITL